jgi:xylulokinase
LRADTSVRPNNDRNDDARDGKTMTTTDNRQRTTDNQQMSTPRLAGIDLGTSSLKVVLTDEAGQVISDATADYTIHAPAPGVAEQDPAAWWDALRVALERALEQCGSRGETLLGIGLSGQMHGIVPLDAQDQPLRPAIIWADQRGAAEVERIEQLIDRRSLLAQTGNRASVSFSAPKIMWFRDHEPELFARCHRLLLPKDHLRLRLTGEVATEPTDASATLLFDLGKRDWSDAILDRLAIPRNLLPPIVPSLTQVGVVTKAAAHELGIPAGIPVVAGAGDTPAQATAYGGMQIGVVLATISSGGQLFVATDQPTVDPQGRTHTLCHVLPERWYVMAAMQAAGLALRWLRDLLEIGDPQSPISNLQSPISNLPSYEQLTAEAERVPPGAHGAIFLPYLLGERTPHMDNDARAVLFGLTLRHDRTAVTRAVMEGVAFAFRDGLEIFRELGLPLNELRLGGGGARSPLWRQIMADVLRMPVTLTNADHGAALGAALIAGAGIGHFRDLAEASAAIVHPTATIDPDPHTADRYDELYGTYRALYLSLREHFKAVAGY